MQERKLPKAGQAMERVSSSSGTSRKADRWKGDPVVTFESEKTTSDVYADQDGKLLDRIVAEGDTISTGTVLGYVGTDESDRPELAGGEEPATDASTGETTDDDRSSTRRASPTVRRVAREQGVDLAAVGSALDLDQIRPPDVKEYVDEYADEEQTDILGVCSVFGQPAAVDGEVVPRKMLHLCLTYDHRVVEGDGRPVPPGRESVARRAPHATRVTAVYRGRICPRVPLTSSGFGTS